MYDVTEAKRLADVAGWQPIETVPRDGSVIQITNADDELVFNTVANKRGRHPSWVTRWRRNQVEQVAASLRDAVAEIERLREFVKRVELFSNDGFLARDARALLGDTHAD